MNTPVSMTRLGCFTVTSVPSAVTECDVGDAFHLGNRPVAHSHKYRLGHPIAQWVLEAAKQRPTPDSSIVFDYSAWNVNAVALESFVGCTGSLVVEKLVVAGSEMEGALAPGGCYRRPALAGSRSHPTHARTASRCDDRTSRSCAGLDGCNRRARHEAI